jgi:N-acylglucosamine 2-epimerase
MVGPLIEDIMNNFIDKEKGIILENVGENGEFCDCHEGRLINPGHGNEAMWFLIDLAIRYKDL